MTHPRSQEAIPRGMEGTREAKELPISRKMSPPLALEVKVSCPLLVVAAHFFSYSLLPTSAPSLFFPPQE